MPRPSCLIGCKHIARGTHPNRCTEGIYVDYWKEAAVHLKGQDWDWAFLGQLTLEEVDES